MRKIISLDVYKLLKIYTLSLVMRTQTIPANKKKKRRFYSKHTRKPKQTILQYLFRTNVTKEEYYTLQVNRMKNPNK